MGAYKIPDNDIETLILLKKFSSDEALIKYVQNLVDYAYNKGVAKRCMTELDELNNRIKND